MSGSRADLLREPCLNEYDGFSSALRFNGRLRVEKTFQIC